MWVNLLERIPNMLTFVLGVTAHFNVTTAPEHAERALEESCYGDGDRKE